MKRAKREGSVAIDMWKAGILRTCTCTENGDSVLYRYTKSFDG